MKRLLRSSVLLLIMLMSFPVLASHGASGSEAEGLNWFSGIFSCFARNTGMPPALGAAWFNFLALFIGLYVLVARPTARFLRNRREEVVKNLEEAGAVSAEASRLFSEAEKRGASLDVEIARMKEEILQSAGKEKERLLDETQRQVERIREQGRSEIAQETQRSMGLLRDEILGLATAKAREILVSETTPTDRDRLNRRSVQEIAGRVSG